MKIKKINRLFFFLFFIFITITITNHCPAQCLKTLYNNAMLRTSKHSTAIHCTVKQKSTAHNCTTLHCIHPSCHTGETQSVKVQCSLQICWAGLQKNFLFILQKFKKKMGAHYSTVYYTASLLPSTILAQARNISQTHKYFVIPRSQQEILVLTRANRKHGFLQVKRKCGFIQSQQKIGFSSEPVVNLDSL